MRRDFVGQAAEFGWLQTVDLIAQRAYFIDQELDLLLLAVNDLVQFLELVFSEADHDFQFGQA